MYWKFASALVGGLAAVLFVVLLNFACASAAHGKVGGSVKLGDFTLEVFIGNDNNTHWEGSGPPLCVCLEFLDKDGAVIGSGTINEGAGSGVVNGRAVMWRAKRIDCDDISKCGQASGGGGGGGGGGNGGGNGGGGGVLVPGSEAAFAFAPEALQVPSQDAHLPSKPQWQRVWCGTIDIDDSTGGGSIHNGSGVFEVLVDDPNSNEAFLAIWPILEDGPGAPVPSNVKIEFMAQCLPETFGGRMVFARQSTFVEFVANVNGTNGYAALGQNVADSAIGNGWHIIEVVVPFLDMNLRSGSTNTVEVFSRASGEGVLRHDREITMQLE